MTHNGTGGAREPAASAGHRAGVRRSPPPRRPGSLSAPAGGAQRPAGWPGLVMDVDDDASVARRASGAWSTRARAHRRAGGRPRGWGVARRGGAHGRSARRRPSSRPTSGGCVRTVAGRPCLRCVAQRGGRIALISSIGGVISIPFQGFYRREQVRPGRGSARRWPTRWLRSAYTSRWCSRATCAPTSPPAAGWRRPSADDTVYACRPGPGRSDPWSVTSWGGVPPDDVAVVVRRILDAPAPAPGGSRSARRASASASWPGGSCRSGSSRRGPRRSLGVG